MPPDQRDPPLRPPPENPINFLRKRVTSINVDQWDERACNPNISLLAEPGSKLCPKSAMEKSSSAQKKTPYRRSQQGPSDNGLSVSMSKRLFLFLCAR